MNNKNVINNGAVTSSKRFLGSRCSLGDSHTRGMKTIVFNDIFCILNNNVSSLWFPLAHALLRLNTLLIYVVFVNIPRFVEEICTASLQARSVIWGFHEEKVLVLPDFFQISRNWFCLYGLDPWFQREPEPEPELEPNPGIDLTW